jgi:GNAT superfamily N-acetyltransferase
MESNLQLRDASTADRDAIQSVTLAAYEQYAPILGEMWQLYRANILETLADVKSVEQIVAESQDGIVGSVMLFPSGTQVRAPDGRLVTRSLPEIRLLAVVPSARNQGIGLLLTQECIRRARQTGAAAITLHTNDMMNVAIQMYERMGFARDPKRDVHPVPNVTVKGYRLDLN